QRATPSGGERIATGGRPAPPDGHQVPPFSRGCRNENLCSLRPRQWHTAKAPRRGGRSTLPYKPRRLLRANTERRVGFCRGISTHKRKCVCQNVCPRSVRASAGLRWSFRVGVSVFRRVEDSMNLTALIVQLIAGALGGNAAGNISKDVNLGPLGNSIAGAIGGGLGGQVLNAVLGLGTAAAASGLDIGTIASAFLTGGVSGGLTALLVGFLKAKMAS